MWWAACGQKGVEVYWRALCTRLALVLEPTHVFSTFPWTMALGPTSPLHSPSLRRERHFHYAQIFLFLPPNLHCQITLPKHNSHIKLPNLSNKPGKIRWRKVKIRGYGDKSIPSNAESLQGKIQWRKVLKYAGLSQGKWFWASISAQFA